MKKGRKLLALSVSLVLVFFLLAGVLFGTPALVFAASAGGIKTTIASIIISLMLQAGVAPVNQTWVNNLNTAYGATSTIGTIEDCITNGLLTQSGNSLIDTGLSEAIAAESAYSDLGLSQIFQTTADDAAQFGVAAASGASNIASSAIQVGTLGTIGAFAGAATVGVGVGLLANHLIDKYLNPIRLGLAMNADTNFDLSQYQSFLRIGYISTKQRKVAIVDTAGSSQQIFAHGPETGYVFNNSDERVSLNQWYRFGSGGWSYDSTGLTEQQIKSIVLGYVSSSPDYRFEGGSAFSTDDEALAYLEGIRDGTISYTPDIYSPDLISPIGNLRASEDPNNPGTYTVPGIQNIIPSGSVIAPVDMDDYTQYIQTANQNTDDGLTDSENQGQSFSDFVNPYIQSDPDTPITPEDPDTPITPEDPDTPVTPEDTTNPWPVVDRPVSPEQPTIDPKPTITPEQETEGLNLSTPDLRGIFPFCIPFDLYNLVRGLSASREAPSITVPVDLDGNTITVDLSPYNSVAQILRALELIAFVVGLAVATRKLIGA